MKTKFVKFITAFTILLCASSIANPAEHRAGENERLYASHEWFHEVKRRFPSFKTVIRLNFSAPIDLKKLVAIRQAGLEPAGEQWSSVMGKSSAVFITRARRVNSLKRNRIAKSVEPLDEFFLDGFYWLRLKVVKNKKPKGPVHFSVTSPRNGFGKNLIKVEELIRPDLPYTIKKDPAANRWVEFDCPRSEFGRIIKIDFHYKYRVKVRPLLQHALALTHKVHPKQPGDFSRVSEFLKSSKKISSDNERIKSLAQKIISPKLGPAEAFRRLDNFVEREVAYDWEKKKAFFGGEKIYQYMGQMYRPALETLNRKIGACPDTSILKAAILRAAGFPARTAGRWGHFYTEIYIPDKGWVSPSVTPTGIPLVIATGRRNKPFIHWSPKTSVQVLEWGGDVKIESKSKSYGNTP